MIPLNMGIWAKLIWLLMIKGTKPMKLYALGIVLLPISSPPCIIIFMVFIADMRASNLEDIKSPATIEKEIEREYAAGN